MQLEPVHFIIVEILNALPRWKRQRPEECAKEGEPMISLLYLILHYITMWYCQEITKPIEIFQTNIKIEIQLIG